MTAGALTPEPSTTTSDVPATFCSPARTTPTPGETGYTLDASFLQDPHIRAGLSRYLFEQDTKEAYFLLGLDGTNPPKAIGRVRVQAGAIGGEARTTLTTDISLPLARKPQILFGDVNDSEAVPPAGEAPPPDQVATGATAGAPGSFDPAGSTAPADSAARRRPPPLPPRLGSPASSSPSGTPARRTGTGRARAVCIAPRSRATRSAHRPGRRASSAGPRPSPGLTPAERRPGRPPPPPEEYGTPFGRHSIGAGRRWCLRRSRQSRTAAVGGLGKISRAGTRPHESGRPRPKDRPPRPARASGCGSGAGRR